MLSGEYPTAKSGRWLFTNPSKKYDCQIRTLDLIPPPLTSNKDHQEKSHESFLGSGIP